MIVLRGYIAEPGQNTSALNRWVSGVEGGTGFQDDGWAFRVLLDRSHRVLQISNEVVIHDGRVDPKQTDPTCWNGAFLAVGTGERHRLMIRSDRIGTVPLFWARYSDGVVFGSRLVDMLAVADFGPDPIGVLQMVLLDQPLGERTLLEGVKLFPPATVGVLATDGLQRTFRYWAPTVESAPVDDITPWVEQGVDVLRQANNRALSHDVERPIAWPITGGFDSRGNLGVSQEKLEDSDVFFHVDDLGHFELPAARSISHYFGRQLHVIEADAWMRQAVGFNMELDSGEFNVGHWRLTDAARRLGQDWGCRTTVDGFLQGILFNPAMFFIEGSYSQARDHHLGTARYRAGRLGLNTDHIHIRECLDTVGSDYPSDRDGLSASQRYIMENRSRRMVYGIVRLNQNYLDVRTPGIDIALIDFVMRTPWILRKGARLYRKMITAVAPGLAQIPHDKSGLPLGSQPRRSMSRKLRQRGRYYVNRMWPFGKLFHGKETRFEYLLRRDPAFYAEVRQAIGESGWIREALGSDIVPVLDRHHRRASLIGDVVGALLNVALLEQYATEKRRTDSIKAVTAKTETGRSRSGRVTKLGVG